VSVSYDLSNLTSKTEVPSKEASIICSVPIVHYLGALSVTFFEGSSGITGLFGVTGKSGL
jgi:hypothetical protein